MTGLVNDSLDLRATEEERTRIRLDRVGGAFRSDPERIFQGTPLFGLSDSLSLAKDRRGWHVITKAGYILCTGSTRWRSGAVSASSRRLPDAFGIVLHENLAATTYYCPASGALLSVDLHFKDATPPDDAILDLASLESLLNRPGRMH